MVLVTSTRLFLGLAVAVAAQSAQSQSSYSLTTLQGEFSTPYAGYEPQNTCMDNTGKVFGHRKQYSLVVALLQALNGPGPLGTGNYLRAASWSAAKSATLSPVNMTLPTATYHMVACSENGVYQVVKSHPLQVNTPPGLPMGLVKLGKMTNVPNPQKQEVQPWAVNNSGWVVGVSDGGGSLPVWRATVWRGGQKIELPAAGWGLSTAADINNQGVVVGRVFNVAADAQSYLYDYNDGHAARWVDGKLDWVMPDAPSSRSSALAINDAGQMLLAFYGADPGVPTGVAVWFNDVLTPLSPGKAVWANDINASGVVAGKAGGHAVIWTNGVEIDVTELVTSKGVKLPAGVVLDEVLRINDSGSMVATYRITPGALWPTVVRLNAVP